MLILNTNIKAFNSNVETPEQHSLYFIAHSWGFACRRPELTKPNHPLDVTGRERGLPPGKSHLEGHFLGCGTPEGM